MLLIPKRGQRGQENVCTSEETQGSRVISAWHPTALGAAQSLRHTSEDCPSTGGPPRGPETPLLSEVWMRRGHGDLWGSLIEALRTLQRSSVWGELTAPRSTPTQKAPVIQNRTAGTTRSQVQARHSSRNRYRPACRSVLAHDKGSCSTRWAAERCGPGTCSSRCCMHPHHTRSVAVGTRTGQTLRWYSPHCSPGHNRRCARPPNDLVNGECD